MHVWPPCTPMHPMHSCMHHLSPMHNHAPQACVHAHSLAPPCPTMHPRPACMHTLWPHHAPMQVPLGLKLLDDVLTAVPQASTLVRLEVWDCVGWAGVTAAQRSSRCNMCSSVYCTIHPFRRGNLWASGPKIFCSAPSHSPTHPPGAALAGRRQTPGQDHAHVCGHRCQRTHAGCACAAQVQAGGRGGGGRRERYSRTVARGGRPLHCVLVRMCDAPSLRCCTTSLLMSCTARTALYCADVAWPAR